jgi:hypothetical protein
VGQEYVGQEYVGQEYVGQEYVGQEYVGQERVRTRTRLRKKTPPAGGAGPCGGLGSTNRAVTGSAMERDVLIALAYQVFIGEPRSLRPLVPIAIGLPSFTTRC